VSSPPGPRNRPATSPKKPGSRPSTSGSRPSGSGSRPSASGSRPSGSGARPPAQASKSRAAARRTPQKVSARDLRTEWWQQPWVIPAAVIAVVAVIVVVVLANRSANSGGSPNSSGTPTPAPATIVSQVTSVPAAILASVADGGVAQPLKAVSGQQPLTGAGGKPVVLYVGADYCPFCAAERWSLVIALSRFGTVGGLGLTTSSSTDVYANTNTFDFSHLTFSSDVLDAQAVELQDRNQQPLQTPNPSQAAALQALDQAPYTSSPGAIPFIDIANKYVAISSGYDPQLLQGLTWDQIAAKLANAGDPVTRAIVGNANRITAGICAATGNQPASVCQAAPIQQLASQLPAS
jgi:uncharacterized protein DUF929